MNRPRKPLWSDGLALWPNHLDAQDQYHERLLATRLRALTPYDWGVLDIEIDPHALSAGQVEVTRLEAILPDGSAILVGPADGDLLPSRSLDQFASAKHLDVCVAIARAEDGRANVGARYARVEATARDMATGRIEKPVPWLRHNLELLLEGEEQTRRDVLRIAELVRSPAGVWIVRPTFVPPVLRIGASPYLVDGFQRVLGAMIAKQQAIAVGRRQRHAAAIEFHSTDAPRFWLLDALNTTIPLFVEMVDKTESTGPKEAHLALAQFIGRLSTFRADAVVTDIPKFNYLDLGDVFEAMFARAIDLLDVVIAERHVEIPLHEHGNQYFTGKVRDPELLTCDFFLAVSSSAVPEAELRESMLHLMKMASSEMLGQIVSSAARGVAVTLEHHPPAALPLKPGTIFFRVDKNSDYWRAITRSGSLSLWLPFEKVQPALYAVDSSTLQ
jgi:type VI secretion system protein ImpJ